MAIALGLECSSWVSVCLRDVWVCGSLGWVEACPGRVCVSFDAYQRYVKLPANEDNKCRLLIEMKYGLV
jgi:hypothetical protein